MPRNVNGTYSLPAGNPVTPGTIIETSWANPTMDDLAAAMTDSLSRSGQGGMLVAFKNADGIKSAPGISWVNEPTSGWYRKILNEFWYSVGNEDVFQITKNGIALAPGKTSVGISSKITISETAPVLTEGEQWFESDDGSLWFRYRNPDLSYVWIMVNAVGGDFLPASGLNVFLGDYPDDAAAAVGGVAVGTVYRTGSAMKVRVA